MGNGFASRILNRLMTQLGIGRLGQNALFTTAGLGLRAVIQAAYLIVLSRWLGPNGYGLFAGSVAAAILIAPISGWGISYIIMQRVSRDHTKSRSLWATAILQIVVSGAMLIALVLLVSSIMLADRMSINSMLLVCFAELIALPLALAASSICLALDHGAAAALSICLVPASRLAAVIVPMILGLTGSPDHAAGLHFLGSILGVFAAYCLVTYIDDAPAWRERLSLRQVTVDGTQYAVGTLVGASYQEVDKVLLLQILGATVVGTYTAAFRVMSVFILPVSALMGAALPRLFSAHGTPGGSNLLKTVTLTAIAFGAIASISAALASPLMPLIFGPGYVMSTKYLLMLSPWAFAFALHQSAAIGLTASDRQGVRVVVESLGLTLVVFMNVLFLRSLGVGAAVLALLTAEVFMACGCWLMMRRR